MPRKGKVANKNEIAAFWTKVMRGDPAADDIPPGIKEQLKAAEFLGKHLGMFKEAMEVVEQIEFVGDEYIED